MTTAPDITCTRCSTVTEWNPYCPSCGAFLEFVGDPQWSPDGPPAQPANDPAPVASQQAPTAQSPEDVRTERQRRREERRHRLFHRQHRDATDAAPDPDETVTMPPVVVDAPRSSVVAAPVLGTPTASSPGLPDAPMQRTRSMGYEEEITDPGATCPLCGTLNRKGAAFCRHCGGALAGVVAGPKVINDIPDSKPPRHNPWMTILSVAIIALVVLGPIWWFAWSANAMQHRAQVQALARQAWQFIDPTVGQPAVVQSVVANSNLAGTTAATLTGTTLRTYWASAPTKDYGVGTEILYEFASPVDVDRILLYPGIQNGNFDPRSLATPQQMQVRFSDGTAEQFTLRSPETQETLEQVISFEDRVVTWALITITEVYPPVYPNPNGKAEGSVAISSLNFLQVPTADLILGKTPAITMNREVPQLDPDETPTPTPTSSTAPSDAASASASSSASTAES